MRFHRLAVVVGLAAAVGFVFSAVSAYDSVAHLDRQVHGIHCSFLLGMGSVDASGSSGCHAALMSPYSSVFRQPIWGGVPVSVPGMSVFAFLVFWSTWLVLGDRQGDRRATGFLVAATGVPVLSSAVMGYLSIAELQTACRVCVGIYLASLVAFVAAVFLWAGARKQARSQGLTGSGAGSRSDGDATGARADSEPSELSWVALSLAFGLGTVFVAIPVAAYAFAAPDYSHYVGNCGSLPHPQDNQNVLVPTGPQDRGTTIIEVLDPLCGACRVFEQRFERLPASEQVSRRLMLFPLDNACNWMVDESIHPGACAVSEGILCAGDRATEVLSWAFEQQQAILEASRTDPGAAARMVSQRFPGLQRCLGSPSVRARLNQSLRWAVKNRLQVLTPQLFVGHLRLCDEDTDLGLDYALPRLIARARSTPRVPVPSRPADGRDSLRGPSLAGRKARPDAPSAARPAPGPATAAAAPPQSGQQAQAAESPMPGDDQLNGLAERASEVARTGAVPSGATGSQAGEKEGEAEPGTDETRPSDPGAAAPQGVAAQPIAAPGAADVRRPKASEEGLPSSSSPGADQATSERPVGASPSGPSEQDSPEAP